jgi:hypothetical protein
MDKTKPDQTVSGRPIAKKIVAKMKLHWQRKVVNIKNVIAGLAMAEELQKTVVSQKELEGFHPAHAAYVYAQNQVSVMSEQLTALKEMAPFVDIISKAEDLYVPSAPPMSPLTTSYFTCWAFFDACAGPAKETIGTTILEVGATLGMQPELLRLMRLMQDSRMGFYIHRGGEGDASVLEDLVTGAVYRAIVPAGYKGQKNENWYLRLLPPPFPEGKEHVAFTTPYIVVHLDAAKTCRPLLRQSTVPPLDRWESVAHDDIGIEVVGFHFFPPWRLWMLQGAGGGFLRAARHDNQWFSYNGCPSPLASALIKAGRGNSLG